MSFVASLSSQDPGLVSLFEGSSGPVFVPQVSKRLQAKTVRQQSEEASEETSSSASDADQLLQAEEHGTRPRKRRKINDDHEDLEAAYLDQLARQDVNEGKKSLKSRSKQIKGKTGENSESSDSESAASEEEQSTEELNGIEEDEIPKHESLAEHSGLTEAEKQKRTVFLGNVSTEVIKTKQGKKALTLHLQSVLDPKAHEKIESIRFRSTAFVNDAGPKKAAYAKKELMEETTKSTNAYIVFSSEAAARKVASRLNGTVVLDRHLRADYLGNPSTIDHRRCVFVGNLSFVDEATVTEEGKDATTTTTKRKKAKEPADVEEGLWRTFSKAGKVESVRVVRDKETRISKGFAYVQFEDQNGVEKALLLNEKKFPPLLPRILRVMRAKQMKRSREQTFDPKRGSKVNGIQGMRNGRATTTSKARNVVFEGHRASNKPAVKATKVRKRHAVKPTTRSSRRGAAFKASGGKRNRKSD